MSEQVGVLELAIRDNAQQAGDGLGNLADAVTRVKQAVGKGLGLGPVGTQLVTLSNTINKNVGTSTTLKNLASLFNAISNYSKLGKVNIDTQPFIDLKSALGDGIKMGQVGSQLNAMRNALGGEWDGTGAATAINLLTNSSEAMAQADTAKNIKDLSRSLNEFSNAYKNLPKSTDKIENILKQLQQKTSRDYAAEVQRATEEAQARWEATGRHGIPLNLQQFARKKGSSSGEQMRMDIDSMVKAAGTGFENVESNIQRTTEATEQFRIKLVETKDRLESVKVDATGYETFADSVSQMRMQLDGFPIDKLGQLLEYLKEMHAYTVKPVARGTWEDIGGSIGASNQAAEAFYHTMERTNEIFQTSAWSAYGYKSALDEVYRVLDRLHNSARTLGQGQEKMFLGSGYEPTGETGWTYFNEFGETAEKGWTLWKEGAIEVEGTVSDAMDNIQARLTDGMQMIIYTGKEAEETIKNVHRQTGRMVFYNPKTDAYDRYGSMDDEGTERARKSAEALVDTQKEVKETVDQATASIREATAAKKEYASTVSQNTNMRSYGKDMVEDLVNGYDKIGLMEMKLDGMKQSLADDINANKADTQAIADRTMRIQDLTDKIEALKQAQEDAANGTSVLGRAWESMKNGIKGMFPTITGLLKRFSSLVKYRMLRSVIKYITAGFSEGIENVYRYSQAVGTAFAPAMDSAKTVINQFKNSIGAAVAPVLQALIPLFNQLANAAIQVVNWINQLFALLAGQKSWTRALPVAAQAFEDQKKSAKGASAAMKDLLADWDELNIIQSQTGGSGSGSTKTETDYASMFEEVNDFSERIKTLVDGINEQFGSIWELAKRIGIAVLGWKLSNGFAGLLGALGGLVASGAIIGLVFDVSTMFNKNYLRTGNIGWLIADTLTALIGGVLAKKILTKVLGGQLATVAIPLALAVSSVASIKALVGETDVSALSERGLLTALNAGLKGGAAYGLTLYSLEGLTLGASVGGGLGTGIAMFGAAVGIKAIAEVVRNKEMTADTIKADFLSAGAIGAGVTIAEMAIGGASVAALTLGGGAALFTLGALIGIQAIIASDPKTIRWGDYNATQEEIEGFVQNQVFTIKPDTILELMNPVVEVSENAKKNLKTSVDKVELTLRKLELGYNDDQILEELKEQILGNEANGTKGLMGQFREVAAASQNVIETGVSIIPVAKDKGKGIINTSTETWKAIQKQMSDLGTELTERFEKAFTTGIDEATKASEIAAIKDIARMMNSIANASAVGETMAAAQRNLVANLGNMTRGSFTGMIDYINEYKNSVADAYMQTYDSVMDELGGQMTMAEVNMNVALKRANNNEQDADYLYYRDAYLNAKDAYDAWRDGRNDALEEALKSAMNEDTMELIRRAFLNNVETAITDTDYQFTTLAQSRSYLDDAIARIFTADGNIDFDAAKEVIGTTFDEMIRNVFGYKDYEDVIRPLLDSGILRYVDLIPQEVLDEMNDAFGTSEMNGDGKTKWGQFLTDMMGGPVLGFEMDIPSEGLIGPTVDMSELNNSMTESMMYIEMFKNAIMDFENLSPKLPYGLTHDPFGVFNNGVPSGQLAQPYQPQMAGSVNFTASPGDVQISGEVGVNEGQMASSVQKGMQVNTEVLGNLLRQIANGITQLNGKDFNIKFEPTASAGYFWRKAGMNKNRVDGEV